MHDIGILEASAEFEPAGTARYYHATADTHVLRTIRH